MMRLVSGFAVVAALPMLLPAGVCAAASNTATTLFPLDGPNQLETRVILNCFKSDGHCDFTAGADMLTPDGVTGFPPGLWARQTTEIRSSNRLAYLDAHADGQYERVHKSMGSDEITTIYMGEGPRRSIRPTGASTPPIGRRGNPRPTTTSSPAPTSRSSTPGSISPRPAPARRPPSPDLSIRVVAGLEVVEKAWARGFPVESLAGQRAGRGLVGGEDGAERAEGPTGADSTGT